MSYIKGTLEKTYKEQCIEIARSPTRSNFHKSVNSLIRSLLAHVEKETENLKRNGVSKLSFNRDNDFE